MPRRTTIVLTSARCSNGGHAGRRTPGPGPSVPHDPGCGGGRVEPGHHRALGVIASTVWQAERFAEHGLDGLHDEPPPGKPRSISDDGVEQVIVKTLEESPPNATHWSTRSMARATGMSQSAISRISEGLRAQAASGGGFLALARRRCPLKRSETSSGSTCTPGRRGGALRGREVPDPGPDRSVPVPPLMPGVPERRSTTTCATAPSTSTPPWTWPWAK